MWKNWLREPPLDPGKIEARYDAVDELLETPDRLSGIREILRECGADGWVEKYEKELAALS